MTHTLYMVVAVVIGTVTASQIAMLGAIGRERGVAEAAWISLLGSVVGAAVFLATRSARGEIALPTPLDRPALIAALGLLAALLLLLSVRGIAPYFALAGFAGTAFLLSAAFLTPRLGTALFFGSVTAGTLVGTLALDHIGAFGAEEQRVTVLRIAGAVVLFAGVALIRADG